MKLFLLSSLLTFSVFLSPAQNPNKAAGTDLISIVYDFDGLNLGQTDLPDGDYSNNDMSYQVAADPLAASEVIGDRVLKLDVHWNIGVAEFGKAMNRVVQLNAVADRFNFYIYNPESNSGNASVKITITEDDNGSDLYEDTQDDKWRYTSNILRSGAWQLVSVPLSQFSHANAGGNGSFDASYTNPGGMIFNVSLEFIKPGITSSNDIYYIDMLCFTDGEMPVGNSILELPGKDPYAFAKLGALTGNTKRDLVPEEVQAYLPAGKKITFVNWFVYYSKSTGPADEYTGAEVQNLIDKDYVPVITWEMMFGAYSRLDPAQPRLDKILNGTFDTYIDAFANKIKAVKGQVIIRILHEFEGDWYSWSLIHNDKDPAKYIGAYRHIVDRFRSVGANNVKWMWCVNAEPKPYRTFNFVISCYPGDNYVDIVATDVYNHPNTGVPDWKSFRYTMAESYYLLTKFIPNKPLYICEVACRERYSGEPTSSQTKGDWLCRMNRDLQTYFYNTAAVIFFSVVKEHDWKINSSPAALQSFVDCFWNDGFYYGPAVLPKNDESFSFTVYPNPFSDELRILVAGLKATDDKNEISIYDANAKLITKWTGRIDDDRPVILPLGPGFPSGIYFIRVTSAGATTTRKMVCLNQE